MQQRTGFAIGRWRQAEAVLQRTINPLAGIQMDRTLGVGHVDTRTPGVDAQRTAGGRCRHRPGRTRSQAAVERTGEQRHAGVGQHIELPVTGRCDHVAHPGQHRHRAGADAALYADIAQAAAARTHIEARQRLRNGGDGIKMASVGAQVQALDPTDHVAVGLEGAQAVLDAFDKGQLAALGIALEQGDGTGVDIGRHRGGVDETPIRRHHHPSGSLQPGDTIAARSQPLQEVQAIGLDREGQHAVAGGRGDVQMAPVGCNRQVRGARQAGDHGIARAVTVHQLRDAVDVATGAEAQFHQGAAAAADTEPALAVRRMGQGGQVGDALFQARGNLFGIAQRQVGAARPLTRVDHQTGTIDREQRQCVAEQGAERIGHAVVVDLDAPCDRQAGNHFFVIGQPQFAGFQIRGRHQGVAVAGTVVEGLGFVGRHARIHAHRVIQRAGGIGEDAPDHVEVHRAAGRDVHALRAKPTLTHQGATRPGFTCKRRHLPGRRRSHIELTSARRQHQRRDLVERGRIGSGIARQMLRRHVEQTVEMYLATGARGDVEAHLIRPEGQGHRLLAGGYAVAVECDYLVHLERWRRAIDKTQQVDCVALGVGDKDPILVYRQCGGRQERSRHADLPVLDGDHMAQRTIRHRAAERGHRAVGRRRGEQHGAGLVEGEIGNAIETVDAGLALTHDRGLGQRTGGGVDVEHRDGLVGRAAAIEVTAIGREHQRGDAANAINPELAVGDLRAPAQQTGGGIAREDRDRVGILAGDIEETSVGGQHHVDRAGNAAHRRGIARAVGQCHDLAIGPGTQACEHAVQRVAIEGHHGVAHAIGVAARTHGIDMVAEHVGRYGAITQIKITRGRCANGLQQAGIRCRGAGPAHVVQRGRQGVAHQRAAGVGRPGVRGDHAVGDAAARRGLGDLLTGRV